MSQPDWKLVLEKHFDKKIQPTGKHAYRLLHPLVVRVDGKDFPLPQRSMIVFEQDDIAVVTERDGGPEKHHIALKAITAVTLADQ